MSEASCSEAEFIDLWYRTGGSGKKVAEALGIAERSVLKRRRNIEKMRGEPLISLGANSPDKGIKLPPGRLIESLKDGVILVGSDVHIWPGYLTTAQRAFIHFAKLLKPYAIVINGDLFDGATVSRFPAGMWAQEKRPTVKQELEACQSFTDALQAAYPAKRYWLMGNHDARFEARLAALTPEYEGIPGFSLKDHFQEWKMGMSLWVNDELVIKHRWHQGLHATFQNVLKGGKSILTSHLHSLRVTPWTDYNGDRFGIDSGTLSESGGPQFDYTEDNAKNWRSGFVVLTFAGGRMLWPEVARVLDEGKIDFRGRVWEV
jgi:hypothetical protein